MSDSDHPRPTPHRWYEAAVDTTEEHFALRYGSADHVGWDSWTRVALVGHTGRYTFTVQFLVEPNAPEHVDMLGAVRRELDFYLVDLAEREPWGYAQYHCGTASNIYSDVHWSFVPKQRVRKPRPVKKPGTEPV